MENPEFIPEFKNYKVVITSYSIHYTKLYETNRETINKKTMYLFKKPKPREIPNKTRYKFFLSFKYRTVKKKLNVQNN